MAFDPFNITSLFDIVMNADILTNNLLIGGIFLAFNLALCSRYANRRHGLSLVGIMSMFISAAYIMLFGANTAMISMLMIGVVEVLIGTFIVTKESVFDVP